jgi:Pectate lyase superfamily protein
MRRGYSYLFPLSSMIFLFSTLSYGQAWSGILASSRAIDWSYSGLPATLPDGETTPNPWTPPTRTQCTTSQCNTVGGGSVTASTINAAISSAPAGTYVLIPAGTFAISGTINMADNVTLRGSGAAVTQLTGASFNWGGPSGSGSWAGGSLLTGTIAKGATSVTIASGQTVPSGGRMAALSQCMTGFRATDANYTHYSGGGWVTSCTGTVADPSGPWVCGGYQACDRNGSRNETNPHFQGQIFWIPSGGVSGNTVNFSTPIDSPLWSTANSASIMWMSSPGRVGAGIEDFSSVGLITLTGCYGCWMKGLRIIAAGGGTLTSFVSHSLFANNYLVGNNAAGSLNTIEMGGENDPTVYDTDALVINNIFYNAYIEEDGGNESLVLAYNYFAGTGEGGSDYSGEFPHNPGGQVFILREGNQSSMDWDDATWSARSFDTWFRNWDSCYDIPTSTSTIACIDIGGYSRFDNVIGNVIGSAQAGAGTYANTLGDNRGSMDATGLTLSSSMRWGNYVYCSGDSTHCQIPGGAFDTTEVPTNLSSFGANSTPYQNSVPANHDLPASFFMSGMTAHPSGGTGLSWWKTCTSWTTFPTSCALYSTPPMPPIGPDVTGGENINGYAYNIPAYLAWSNMPTDSNYGNGIRQFDERVYQADGSGGSTSTLNPPTGLTAVVK